jgi:hypothetical protein
VAVDDGVLVVQVTKDAPTGGPEAATSIADTILNAGPVEARVPSVPGLEPLDFTGDICDLITTQDLKDVMKSRFTAMAALGTCTYQGGNARSQTYLSVSLVPIALASLRTRGAQDVTVAERPGLLLTKSGALMVDVGNDRVLQLIAGASPTPKGAAAKKLIRQAETLAGLAIDRMTPAAAAPSPDPGVCALLSVDALGSATGKTFGQPTPANDTTCIYTSDDQRVGVMTVIGDAPDLDTAWSNAVDAFHLPAQPAHTTVAGHAAYDAPVGTDSAAVAVDLTGIPNDDGKVLGVLLLGNPDPSADPVASALSIAEAFVGNQPAA